MDILHLAVDSFVKRVEHFSSSLRIRRGGCNSRDLSKCTFCKKSCGVSLRPIPSSSSSSSALVVSPLSRITTTGGVHTAQGV